MQVTLCDECEKRIPFNTPYITGEIVLRNLMSPTYKHRRDSVDKSDTWDKVFCSWECWEKVTAKLFNDIRHSDKCIIFPVKDNKQ